MNEVRGNKISLLVTEAEVRSIKLTGTEITVEVALLCQGRYLTTMYLYSDTDPSSPSYIERTIEIKTLTESLFNLIRKGANVSLDRVSKTLEAPAATIVDEV